MDFIVDVGLVMMAFLSLLLMAFNKKYELPVAGGVRRVQAEPGMPYRCR
jgi:hypothetical protein